MVKSFIFNSFSVHAGASKYSFSLGFSVSRFGIEIDLGFIWISLEY